MTTNRLQQLHDAGQSIWLDYIDRTILRNGDLERRIREEALTGMTSNPTIFEKALAEGTAYDDQLRRASPELDTRELFDLVATADVQAACDLFKPLYMRTEGANGFVSLEVAPDLADDEEATVAEARRLWTSVNRPNAMIKVPGTSAGARAARRLLAEGVNVNITLLFALEAYEAVIEAYLGALEDRVANGQAVAGIASVASFFVSRVDTEVDRRLDALAKQGGDRPHIERLKGTAAIANAKLAYRLFQRSFSGDRWEQLRRRGAAVQRPLWASTSTKNPAYRDVMYVEELIGPHTVNTMPPQTIEAFADHGEVKRTVDREVEAAERRLAELEELGVSMSEVTDKLLVDGLASFQKSYDALLAGLEQKMVRLRGEAGEAIGAR